MAHLQHQHQHQLRSTVAISGPSTSFHGRSALVQRSTRPRTARRVALGVYAAWVEPVFSPSKVASAEVVSPELTKLVVDVGDQADEYTIAGQYLQIKVGEDSKAAFMAIANAPGALEAGHLELLVKTKPDSTAELLCGLKAGDDVLTSPAAGGGFPIGKIPAPDFSTVLLFATGTGISPVKALIESGTLDADKRSVKLYYGATSDKDMAYTELFDSWKAAGVEVTPVFSGDDEYYVQNKFEPENDITDPAATGLVLCGQNEMCDAVRQIVTDMGVSADACLTNY